IVGSLLTKFCDEEVTPESLSRSLLWFRCWLAGSFMPWKPEVLIDGRLILCTLSLGTRTDRLYRQPALLTLPCRLPAQVTFGHTFSPSRCFSCLFY
ncbi:hypothetical protein LEMLEM_LOCUS24124, partial [Lemmus lemmus]